MREHTRFSEIQQARTVFLKMKFLCSCLFIVSVMSLGYCQTDIPKRLKYDHTDFDDDWVIQGVYLGTQDLLDLQNAVSEFIYVIDELLLQNAFKDIDLPLKLRTELQNIREDISNTNGNNVQDLENKIKSAEATCGQCINQMSSKRSSFRHGEHNVFLNTYKEFAKVADRCISRPPKKPKDGKRKLRFHARANKN